MLPREKTELLSFTLGKGKNISKDTRRPTDFCSWGIQVSHTSNFQHWSQCQCFWKPRKAAALWTAPLSSLKRQVAQAGKQVSQQVSMLQFTLTGRVCELLVHPVLTRPTGWTCSGLQPVEILLLRFYCWASHSTYAFPHIPPELVLLQQEGEELQK